MKNTVGAENVGINVEPYESEANQNQMEDSDFDDDSFSSTSRSSLVSNAPSVQHFNISVCYLIMYSCMLCSYTHTNDQSLITSLSLPPTPPPPPPRTVHI